MAKAIGPQKTSRAIGIMPRMAAAAVSRIGRRRCRWRSITASQAGLPCGEGSSICTTRITELRMMMPISADDAQDGDEPHRLPREQQRRDHADQAERRHAHHQEEPLEALQLHHQHGDHQEQHQRHHGEDAGLRLGAFLHGAADLDL